MKWWKIGLQPQSVPLQSSLYFYSSSISFTSSLSFLVAFPRRQHNCTLLHFTLSDKAAFFIIINWRFFLFYSCSAAFFTLSWRCECWISHLTLWHFDLASPSAYKKLQNWFMQRILIEKFPRFACAAQLINGELFKWKLMRNESRWCDFFLVLKLLKSQNWQFSELSIEMHIYLN